MLSTSVPISTMDGEDTEASTPLNSVMEGKSLNCQGGPIPSCWLLYFKPIVVISVGTLLFVSGTTLALLSFTQVGNVPYLLGPLFLFVGLMFLVTGLVWVPMLKQSLEQQPLTEVNHGKGDQVEHKHH